MVETVTITVHPSPGPEGPGFFAEVDKDHVRIYRKHAGSVTWEMASDDYSQQFDFRVRKKSKQYWPLKKTQKSKKKKWNGGNAKKKYPAVSYWYNVEVFDADGEEYVIDPVMEIDDGDPILPGDPRDPGKDVC